MSNYSYTMEPYTLQSYFKSLCESFCIAYKQVKKTEKLQAEEEKEFNDDELKAINTQLAYPSRFWSDKLWNLANQIEGIIGIMKSENCTIIVTDKKEIIALMAFFRSCSVENYRIINLSEEYLESFPQDEMSQEFLNAYRTAKCDEMNKVFYKYF